MRSIWVILLSFIWVNAIAQKDSTKTSTRDQEEFFQAKLQKPQFTPFFAPSYTPETNLMFVLGGLFSFDLRPLDPLIQRSFIPFSIGYGITNAFMLNAKPTLYGIANHYDLQADLWIKNQQDHYFGIGYENGLNVPKSDSTTLYDRYWWQVKINFLRNFKRKYKAGVILDLNYTRADDPNPMMEQDPNFTQYGDENRNSGFGLVVQYDSRDMAVNAYSGLFFSLSSTFYGKYIRGENIYQVYELEYRQYKQIKRPGMTLAWTIKWRLGTNDIPWPEMSQLGTPFDLRGYRWGQYRDKSLQYGIVEYRHMFMRKLPDKKGNMMSRHGFVTWVGTGNVAPRLADIEKWLPNFGLGYRFAIQTRMNIRLDMGLGNESNGFYVSFNEAF